MICDDPGCVDSMLTHEHIGLSPRVRNPAGRRARGDKVTFTVSVSACINSPAINVNELAEDLARMFVLGSGAKLLEAQGKVTILDAQVVAFRD